MRCYLNSGFLFAGFLWCLASLEAALELAPDSIAFPKNLAANGNIATLGVRDPDTGLGEHQAITGIAGGSTHSLLVKEDGSLWATGNNQSGQLGDGTSGGDFWGFDVGVDRNSPILIKEGGVKEVSAGEEHSLVLMEEGSLWAAGENHFGQLGDGSEEASPSLKLIIESGVVACSAGLQHSLFVKSDGSLWGMGLNEWGALGDGSGEGVNPVQLSPLKVVESGVVDCAAGKEHSLFLKSDGSLWAMGANTFGQLGDGSGVDQYAPVMVVDSGVVTIAAGYNHSMFVKSDESLWGMGDNFYGQLGDRSFEDRFSPVKIVRIGVAGVDAGELYSVFLKTNGSVWTMGSGELGRLGNGNISEDKNVPVKAVSLGVSQIAAGRDHWLAIREDGTLLGTGLNFHGQLGTSISGGQAHLFDNGIDLDAPGWISGAQYSVPLGDQEDDRQYFTLSGNQLILASPVNLLGRSSYTVRVLAQTPDLQSVEQVLVLNVDNGNFTNENPAAIPLQPVGWIAQDWFGMYYSLSDTWIYHGTLGWLFLASEPAGEGYWMWSPEFIWIWVSPVHFPWVYRDGHGWLYFPDESMTRTYYYAATGEWVDW